MFFHPHIEGIDKHLIAPVSYTHLDVYKRQALKPPTPQAAIAASEPPLMMAFALPKRMRLNASAMASVSYTHLDVYKRQERILSDMIPYDK